MSIKWMSMMNNMLDIGSIIYHYTLDHFAIKFMPPRTLFC